MVPTPWTVTHDTPSGTVSSSGVTYQPWLGDQDKERIFFGSIHGYGADAPPGAEATTADGDAAVSVFYPGSGGPDSQFTDVAKGPTVRNVPLRLRTRSAAWRKEMMSRILVPLRAFAAGVFVYMAIFELAPPHAHGRGLSVRYLGAFAAGLALIVLSEAAENGAESSIFTATAAEPRPLSSLAAVNATEGGAAAAAASLLASGA